MNKGRRPTVRWLALGAVLAVVSSAIWAWVSFDYWEAGPVVATILATVGLSGAAMFAWRRRVLSAVLVGILVGITELGVVLMITLARWEG